MDKAGVNNGWDTNYDLSKYREITHWMPLPEPPNKVDQYAKHIKTKTINNIDVQENGIIRNQHKLIIGRCVEGVGINNVDSKDIYTMIVESETI
jgi:hypothetical protein